MKRHCVVLAIVMVSCLFSNLMPLHARQVAHHGSQIDADDPAGCPSCHYGGQKDIPGCNGKCIVDPGLSHPLFPDYPPPGKIKDYRSLAEARKAGIRFHGKKMTCLSCHDPVSRVPYHFPAGLEQTGLCRACHIR
ncbi:MAG: hypothetical protein ACOY32_08775 [Thermodesulfobacteriota bacterium]